MVAAPYTLYGCWSDFIKGKMACLPRVPLCRWPRPGPAGVLSGWSEGGWEFGDGAHDSGAHAGGSGGGGACVGLGVVGLDDVAVGHGDGERVDVEDVVAGPCAGGVAVPGGLERFFVVRQREREDRRAARPAARAAWRAAAYWGPSGWPVSA